LAFLFNIEAKMYAPGRMEEGELVHLHFKIISTLQSMTRILYCVALGEC
jgi:hypothetical protein